jgi:uncharacterized membrane protein
MCVRFYATMIQRIQTIHLICAAIVGIVSMIIGLCHPFLNDADQGLGFVHYANAAILLIGSVISFCSIFMFRNRQRQMKVVALSCAIFVAGYALVIACAATGVIQKPWSNVVFYLPILCIVFDIMARKRIKYDDDLVRSADRLR